jgi:large subunit ribosomal protein L6
MAKKKSKKQAYVLGVQVPQGVSVELAQQEGDFVKLVLKKGAVQNSKLFDNKVAKLKLEEGKLTVSAKREGKRQKTVAGTFQSHIKNMLAGLDSPHVYKLKVCAGHFPVQVSLTGSTFTIKNFLGESVPRVLQIKEGVKVKVSGTEVVVESPDLELAGQTAASIETLSRITGKDSRIFQDGIYIVEKDGKPI